MPKIKGCVEVILFYFVRLLLLRSKRFLFTTLLCVVTSFPETIFM